MSIKPSNPKACVQILDFFTSSGWEQTLSAPEFFRPEFSPLESNIRRYSWDSRQHRELHSLPLTSESQLI